MRQCRSLVEMEIFTTRTYERAIRKVVTADAHEAMENAIAAGPTVAPVIPGTGGIRTIYFYHAGPEAVYLLTAYTKAARENLSPADKKAWTKLVVAIKKEETR